jgi:hypothetical protein
MRKLSIKTENPGSGSIGNCNQEKTNNYYSSVPTESEFKKKTAMIIALFFLFFSYSLVVNAQAFDIDQVRNGSAAAPENPADWVNGNLTPTHAHYVEGYSVPYRAIATGLAVGVPITLRIGYDTKDNDRNALDYLTYYNRLDGAGISHNAIFGHSPEVVDPLLGVSGVSATTDVIAITAPASVVLPDNRPAGSSQPLTSYNALPANEKVMTIFGGTFVAGSFIYVSQDPITATDAHAQTVVEVTFIPTSTTAVLAWGGHIASRLDWGTTDGVPNSAGGISGSPYHMRLIEYRIAGITTSLGNQDRSLKASAVAAPPPECQIIPALHEVCVGTNVQFLASATSGTPPYVFTWYKDGNFVSPVYTGSVLTINSAQAADAGMYEVIVTDQLGLKDTCHGQLIVNPLPPCSIGTPGPGDLICNHGNYTIGTSLSASLYHFDWDMAVDGSPSGWAIVGSDTLQTITFSSGDCGSIGFMVNFTLTVTNRATGCVSSCTASFAPRAPQCAVDIRPAVMLTCAQTSQYLLASYATDIINPTLEWKRNGVSIGAGISDGSSLDSILVTQAGTYRFTVTDPANSSNTCFAEVTVTQDTAKPLLSETHTDVSCNGLSNGAIDLSVSGGASPFTYDWSNGANTQDLSGLAAGPYEVIVTGANGCMDSLTVNINQPNDLAIIESHVNVACNGGKSGSIDITVSGGTSPYTFLWSDGATTEDVSGLAAGSYEVIVTDDHGCMDSVTVVVAEPSDLGIIESHTNVACYGGNDGAINITVSGGAVPYSYDWSNGASTEDVSGLVAGSYEVIVSDDHGCMDSITVAISQPADLSVIESHNDANCFGESNGSINITVSGGTSPYSFDWSNGASTEDVSGLAAGSYEVIVTDDHGCMDSLTVEIEEPGDVSCLIDARDTMPVCGSAGNELGSSVTNANSYTWSVTGTGWSITAGQGTAGIFYTAGTGAGTFKLIVANENNCLDSCMITINCHSEDEFCTLTQGFYGSGRGVACATGERGGDLIYRLLGAPFGDLVIGKGTRTLTITQNRSYCVTKRLPAGGTAAMLPVGEQSFASDCSTSIPISRNGRFANVLLGQTITLGLNLRMDADLGSLVIGGTIMTTIEAVPGVDGVCGTEDDAPIEPNFTVRYIPQTVIDALNTIYGSATVANLFDLANRALGGMSTADASLNDINTAVSAFNEGFDHCKFLRDFSSPSGRMNMSTETSVVEESNEVMHFAYPNPFANSTTIEFSAQSEGVYSVDVFDLSGQKVAALFYGNVKAGEAKRLVFDGEKLPDGYYLYIISSKKSTVSSKLMLMK